MGSTSVREGRKQDEAIGKGLIGSYRGSGGGIALQSHPELGRGNWAFLVTRDHSLDVGTTWAKEGV